MPDLPNPESRVEQYLANLTDGTTEIPKEPESRIEQYLDYLAKNGIGQDIDPEDLAALVEAWLDTNFTNPDSPPLDRTLTSSNSAAPADLVGNLKQDLNSLGLAVVNGVLNVSYAEEE